MSPLRIATRKSPLAVWQAERVRDLLAARGQPAELVRITTTGDRILDRPLAEVGGKGLFVKELEEALRDGRADLAVHSAKDVPFALPEGFGLCAFPPRDDPRDALVLALAGLRRLGLEEHVTEVLPVEVSLPAAGQGALAIEAARGSRGWTAAAPLDDPGTSPCVRAERALLAKLAGGCTIPLAAYATREGKELHLRAALGGPDGRGGVQVLRAQARGVDPEELGAQVAAKLLDAGAAPLLEAARTQAGGLPAPER